MTNQAFGMAETEAVMITNHVHWTLLSVFIEFPTFHYYNCHTLYVCSEYGVGLEYSYLSQYLSLE